MDFLFFSSSICFPTFLLCSLAFLSGLEWEAGNGLDGTLDVVLFFGNGQDRILDPRMKILRSQTHTGTLPYTRKHTHLNLLEELWFDVLQHVVWRHLRSPGSARVIGTQTDCGMETLLRTDWTGWKEGRKDGWMEIKQAGGKKASKVVIAILFGGPI